MKAIANLLPVLCFTALFSQAASIECIRLYNGSVNSAAGYSALGETASFVAQILKMDTAEIDTSKARLESVKGKDWDAMSAEISAKTREFDNGKSSMSFEQVKINTEKLVKSGFLMGRVHQAFARLALTGVNLKPMILEMKTKEDQLHVFKTRKADEMLSYFPEMVKDNSWSGLSKKEKKEVLGSLYFKFYELEAISANSLIKIMDSVSDVLNQPGGPELMRILFEKTMYDMAKILSVNQSGFVTKWTGEFVDTAIRIGPFIVGSIIAGQYYSNTIEFLTLFGSGAVASLGSSIALNQKHVNNGKQIQESRPIPTFKDQMGMKVLSLPKNASVQWRRWLQRRQASKKALDEYKDKLSIEILDHETQSVEKSLETTFELINSELMLDLGKNPVAISVWGRGLGESLDLVLTKNKKLSDDQDRILAELVKISKGLNDPNVNPQDKSALKFRNRELSGELGIILENLGQLSSDILTVSYALDLYKEKIDSDLASGNIHPNFKQIMVDKNTTLDANQKVLIQTALSIKSRISTSISAFGIESMEEASRYIELVNLVDTKK